MDGAGYGWPDQAPRALDAAPVTPARAGDAAAGAAGRSSPSPAGPPAAPADSRLELVTMLTAGLAGCGLYLISACWVDPFAFDADILLRSLMDRLVCLYLAACLFVLQRPNLRAVVLTVALVASPLAISTVKLAATGTPAQFADIHLVGDLARAMPSWICLLYTSPSPRD